MGGKQSVQRRDEKHHVIPRPPVEIVLSVNIYLLGGEPFHAVRNAPCPLMAEQGSKRDTEPGIDLSSLCEPVVVVRLREMDERTETFSPYVRRREIVLELPTVIGLEYLGIRPVESRPVEKRIRDINRSA